MTLDESSGEIPLREPELVDWGARLGRAAATGNVFVALYGELGAGKSTLVRAACRALGVEGHVASPTFALVNVHAGGGLRVHHADLYRLDPPVAERTLLDMGWPDLTDLEAPVFVEWADRAADWLPDDRWDLHLRIDPSNRDRRLARIARWGSAPMPPTPGADGSC